MANPLNMGKHAQERVLDRHPSHRNVSILARVPGIVELAEEASLRLLSNHRCKLNPVGLDLWGRDDVPNAPHDKQAALHRRLHEVCNVVAVAEVATVPVPEVLGRADVGLVALATGGLCHRKLIHSRNLPQALIDTVAAGILQRCLEAGGRLQEGMPLGPTEELLVAREHARVALLAADKVEICLGVVDHVCGVGCDRGHGCWLVVWSVCMLEEVLVVGAYATLCGLLCSGTLPGSNDVRNIDNLVLLERGSGPYCKWIPQRLLQ